MQRIREVAVGLFLALVSVRAANGQIIMDPELTVFTPPAKLFSTGPRLSSARDAEQLILATLASAGSYGAQVQRDIASKNLYVIIHVLRWSDPTAVPAGKATRTVQTVQAQNWYVFRGGSDWSQNDFASAKRLYGTKGLYLLVVHLNRSTETDSYRLNYRVTIAKKQAANVANLLAAAKLLGFEFNAIRAQSVAERRDLFAARFIPVDDVPSDITIAPEIMPLAGEASAASTPRSGSPGGSDGNIGELPPTEEQTKAEAARQAEAKKKAQANKVEGTKAGTQAEATKAETAKDAPGAKPAGAQATAADRAAQSAAEAAQSAEAARAAAIAAAKTATDELAELKNQLIALEKKLSAAAEAPPPPPPTAQALGDATKFDNEGRYWWDVSIGVPVRKVSDFARTESGLDVKTASKSTAFAMANIYFRPVDVKSPALNMVPSALVGFGLEEKPLHRIFVGGAWGPVYANFFAGVAFKRVEAEGKTTYPSEVTFGLNVPILSITKRLTEQTN